MEDNADTGRSERFNCNAFTFDVIMRDRCFHPVTLFVRMLLLTPYTDRRMLLALSSKLILNFTTKPTKEAYSYFPILCIHMFLLTVVPGDLSVILALLSHASYESKSFPCINDPFKMLKEHGTSIHELYPSKQNPGTEDHKRKIGLH